MGTDLNYSPSQKWALRRLVDFSVRKTRPRHGTSWIKLLSDHPSQLQLLLR
jgi:hypothetical protein